MFRRWRPHSSRTCLHYLSDANILKDDPLVPSIDLNLPPAVRTPPDFEITPELHPKHLSLILATYLPDQSLDKKYRRISPVHATLDRLPEQIAIFTAGADNVVLEVEQYFERVRNNVRLEVTYRRFDKCNHGFDTRPPKPRSER